MTLYVRFVDDHLPRSTEEARKHFENEHGNKIKGKKLLSFDAHLDVGASSSDPYTGYHCVNLNHYYMYGTFSD